MILTVIEEIKAALEDATSDPDVLIMHPTTYWRLKFARFGSSKQRARLSVQVPRHQHPRKQKRGER